MNKDFEEHLEKTSKIVSEWPEWKRNINFNDHFYWEDGEFIPSGKCRVL